MVSRVNGYKLNVLCIIKKEILCSYLPHSAAILTIIIGSQQQQFEKTIIANL